MKKIKEILKEIWNGDTMEVSVLYSLSVTLLLIALLFKFDGGFGLGWSIVIIVLFGREIYLTYKKWKNRRKKH